MDIFDFQAGHYEPEVALPQYDFFGASVEGNFPAKKPRHGTMGRSGTYPGLKGICHSHSKAETTACLFLDFVPSVLTYRSQYLAFDKDKFREKYRLGKPILETDKMTIDIDVLYHDVASGQVRQHGVSCKDNEDGFVTKSAARRVIKESKFYAGIASTWQGVSLERFPRVQVENYLFLRKIIFNHGSWARPELISLKHPARQVAEIILSTYRGESLEAAVRRVAALLRYESVATLCLFCTAIFLGYVKLDHRFYFKPSLPIIFLGERGNDVIGDDRRVRHEAYRSE